MVLLRLSLLRFIGSRFGYIRGCHLEKNKIEEHAKPVWLPAPAKNNLCR